MKAYDESGLLEASSQQETVPRVTQAAVDAAKKKFDDLWDNAESYLCEYWDILQSEGLIQAYVEWKKASAIDAAAPKWLPIETAPRNEPINTYGEFFPLHSEHPINIMVRADELSNSPYYTRRTFFEHEDMVGTYIRTHYCAMQPLPAAPVADATGGPVRE